MEVARWNLWPQRKFDRGLFYAGILVPFLQVFCLVEQLRRYFHWLIAWFRFFFFFLVEAWFSWSCVMCRTSCFHRSENISIPLGVLTWEAKFVSNTWGSLFGSKFQRLLSQLFTKSHNSWEFLNFSCSCQNSNASWIPILNEDMLNSSCLLNRNKV